MENSQGELEEQLEGSRIEIADFKQNARDFILWKPSKDEQPGWNSPWGRGRPGWHIECVQCLKCLDTPFDIHCGGVDLTFPHHEMKLHRVALHLNLILSLKILANTGFIMGL